MGNKPLEQLKAKVRHLEKINKLLEKELENLKRLKPGQISRARKREIVKEEMKCKTCGEGEPFDIPTPTGMKSICLVCRNNKLRRK